MGKSVHLERRGRTILRFIPRCSQFTNSILLMWCCLFQKFCDDEFSDEYMAFARLCMSKNCWKAFREHSLQGFGRSEECQSWDLIKDECHKLTSIAAGEMITEVCQLLGHSKNIIKMWADFLALRGCLTHVLIAEGYWPFLLPVHLWVTVVVL